MTRALLDRARYGELDVGDWCGVLPIGGCQPLRRRTAVGSGKSTSGPVGRCAALVHDSKFVVLNFHNQI